MGVRWGFQRPAAYAIINVGQSYPGCSVLSWCKGEDVCNSNVAAEVSVDEAPKSISSPNLSDVARSASIIHSQKGKTYKISTFKVNTDQRRAEQVGKGRGGARTS